MGLICIGDEVVTSMGTGHVVDMNARKETVCVAFPPDGGFSVVRWFNMGHVTLLEDLPDPTNIDEVEAFLSGKRPSYNKATPVAASLASCACDCGAQGNCGNMSSNGFHTPMTSSCRCLMLDCHCVGGEYLG